MHYLKQLRLLKAAQLLTSTPLSVKEICAAVGYQDFSHFVRDFRQAHGYRPSEYRWSAGITLADDNDGAT